jgi:MFS family permease
MLVGIATIGQGLIKGFNGIVGMRFILGIFEAGLFPGKPTVLAPVLRAHINSKRMHLLDIDVL